MFTQEMDSMSIASCLCRLICHTVCNHRRIKPHTITWTAVLSIWLMGSHLCRYHVRAFFFLFFSFYGVLVEVCAFTCRMSIFSLHKFGFFFLEPGVDLNTWVYIKLKLYWLLVSDERTCKGSTRATANSTTS